MKVFTKALFFILVIALMGGISFSVEKAADKGDIEVTMEGFRWNDGVAMVALWASDAGFPDGFKKAMKVEKATIKDKKASFIIKDVPYGSYAISVIHDKNNNGVLEKNFLGIPQEDCGNSNNVDGMPSFKGSTFEHKSKVTKLPTIKVVFF